jgi:hypothetical protein
LIDPDRLQALIAECLDNFYKHRLEKIRKLQLRAVLRRKNPYLFRALHTEKASEIVEQILSAFLMSSDETIFGNDFFEPIAREVSGGQASDGKGVDVVVHTETEIRAYAVKSGANAQNASARDKQEQEFNELRQRLAKLRKRFDPVLAAAYGRINRRSGVRVVKARSFREVAGQAFWTELTGDSDFYLKLMRLMQDIPAKHQETYKPEWDAAINRLTGEFIADFCTGDGNVDWDKLTAFVSSETKPS